MDEEQIIDSLVRHFGQENAEEIADTFEKPPYGYGEIYSFEVDGEEWNAYESEEEAHDAAVADVREMLDDSPEMFNQSFIEQHMMITDSDKRIIAGEEATDYAYEIVRNQVEDFVDELNVPEEYLDDPEEWSDLDEALEKLEHEKYVEVLAELEDPIQYFVHDRGIYSVEDLLKSNFIRVDVDAAADDAVNSDGWAHFLSRYDGEYEEIDYGVVIFRA